MRRLRRRWWLRVPPIAFAALALAGTAAAARVRIVGVDTSGYPDLRATVVAPAGTAPPTLLENGVPVTNLSAINLGQSKSVVLAVDRSQSMRGRALADAVAAARAFVAAKQPSDRIEVVAFGREAVPLTGFSTSRAEIDDALRQVRPDSQPGTALWDAVSLASTRLAAEGRTGRVLILLTDGRDVSSTSSFAQAVAAAHRARTSVYAVGIAGRDFAPRALEQVARVTGGSYRQVSSTEELAGLYASIGRTLSHTWELRYPTSARPGDRLDLVASVPRVGRGSLTVALAGSAGRASNPVWRARWAPVAVSAAVGGLVLLACFFWLSAREGRWVQARLRPHLGQVRRTTRRRRRPARGELLKGLVSSSERTFARFSRFRALQRLLERADLPLRAAELLYLCLGCGFVLGLVAAVSFHSVLLTLAFLAVGATPPLLFVRFKANARVKAFDNQLPDLLITISASLKAGHSFRHAIQAVVDEGAQPTAKEFQRVLTQTQLGRPLDDGLAEMAERVGSKNLAFVINSVTIQRQVGGSLAGLFDMVAETVRQRQQFHRKVRGLTAMGRASAYVLTALPFVMALAITALNPGYMAPLYHSSTGHLLIVLGLTMMAIGSLLLKKIVAFRG
jgi:tight adherence protein B